MKKVILFSTFCFAFFTIALTGCKANKNSDEVVLRIANWEEYIDEGDWDDDELIDLEDGTEIIGKKSMISDFEKWYYKEYHKKVKVEYSTFGTNEDLYNQLTIGDKFDLVCPSEYMAMKMMSEKMLIPYSEGFKDKNNKNNYYSKGVSKYINKRLEDLEITNESLGKYIAGYMWGTLGYVYNPEMISEAEAADWNLLRNEKFYKRVTTKDSVRDCYIAALGALNQKKLLSEEFLSETDYYDKLSDILNDTSDSAIASVQSILTDIKDNVYSFEVDSGKSDLVTGKVAANLQWSGDGVYSIAQAAEDGVKLCYSVPEAGSNLWFDGWCMLKSGIEGDSNKQQAAEAFVNFVSRPDNVIRNMYYIGYTSVISGGSDKKIFDYAKWCFEAEDDSEETADYNLDYFFENEDKKKGFTICADKEEFRGELFAQYPTREVLDKSVIMKYFPDDINKKISRMWINVRCFHF